MFYLSNMKYCSTHVMSNNMYANVYVICTSVIHQPFFQRGKYLLVSQLVNIQFSSNVRQGFLDYVNHAQSGSWKQPALRSKGEVFCSSEEQQPLIGLELIADRVRVRHAYYCAVTHFRKYDNKLLNLLQRHRRFVRQVDGVRVVFINDRGNILELSRHNVIELPKQRYVIHC